MNKINLSGVNELDITLPGTTTTTIVSPGVVALVNTGGGTPNTHDESLTDGNANFIFAATLTTGGDIITVIGVAN
jgi:hypothetical protein